MSAAEPLDLNDLVDGQRLGLGSLLFFVLAALALVSDGYDLAAMGYVAPELLKDWHLSPTALVPAFSAGIIGMMAGGPLLGLLGDRYGRKRLIVAGLAAVGVTTLATMAVRSTTDLVLLRFVTGIGLGGVIPNVGALVAEMTPRRIRGRLLVIVSLGVPLGIALPGLVAATLVPQFGWRVLLLVGGLLPLAVAFAASGLMPESIKYLVERGDRSVEANRLARTLRPDIRIGDATRIAISDILAPRRRGSVKQLFLGEFALVTPLLWICQSTNQMANFFSLTWLPTLLQSAGASTSQAGAAASLFSIGGIAGGIVLLFIIDRLGVVPLVALFIFGAPLVAAMALPDLSFAVHAAVIAGAGVCVTGVQLGTTALLGMVHPTAIRSMGTGWTQAAGRLGALAAPVVGGILLSFDVPIRELPLAPATLLVIGALASIVLAIICVRRFAGMRVAEFSIGTPAELSAV